MRSFLVQFAECQPKKRGRPVSNPNSKEEESGDLCSQKRGRDKKTIYYHTSKYKAGRRKQKATRMADRKRRGNVNRKLKAEKVQVKKGRLLIKSKGFDELIKKIEAGDIKTFKKLRELMKPKSKMSKEERQIKLERGLARAEALKKGKINNKEKYEKLAKEFSGKSISLAKEADALTSGRPFAQPAHKTERGTLKKANKLMEQSVKLQEKGEYYKQKGEKNKEYAQDNLVDGKINRKDPQALEKIQKRIKYLDNNLNKQNHSDDWLWADNPKKLKEKNKKRLKAALTRKKQIILYQGKEK